MHLVPRPVAAIAAALLISLVSSAGTATAQCSFFPVGPALTDLGGGEYYRLTGRQGSAPTTWTFVRQPGITGGLYPNGSNVRPPAHEAAGLALAALVQPLDPLGTPSSTGAIGFASIGMSNTVHGFEAFMRAATHDPSRNPRVVLVNGAAGGGTVESWTDTTDTTRYQMYWTWFDGKIAAAKLTHAQVQVVWAEMTSTVLNFAPFPDGIRTFEGRVLLLMKELRTRLPNLKIVYLTTRARAFNYFAGEPVGFEQGLGVKWLIERQLNGDPVVNYDPARGAAVVPYLSWGPYFWIDGTNARSDGRTWPLSYSEADCLHPTATGYGVEAEMLWRFFTSDTTTVGWFLAAGAPPPPPPPPPVPDTVPPVISGVGASGIQPTSATIQWATDEAASGEVDFSAPCPAAGCASQRATSLTLTHSVALSGLEPATTYTYRVWSADASGNAAMSDEYSFTTPAAPPPPATTVLSSWGFATPSVTDDVNGCTGCSSGGATWSSAGIVSGAFQFNGNAALNLGTFPYLNGTSAFTLSFWMKPGFDARSASLYCAFGDGGNVNVCHVDPAKPWQVTVRTTTGTLRVDLGSATWATGTWHQAALTYSATAMKVYWDGVLVGSTPAAGGSVMPDSGKTYLGASGVRNAFFVGELDEVRVHDRELSEDEIYAAFLVPAS